MRLRIGVRPPAAIVESVAPWEGERTDGEWRKTPMRKPQRPTGRTLASGCNGKYPKPLQCIEVLRPLQQKTAFFLLGITVVPTAAPPVGGFGELR